jgi:hypothetical protein
MNGPHTSSKACVTLLTACDFIVRIHTHLKWKSFATKPAAWPSGIPAPRISFISFSTMPLATTKNIFGMYKNRRKSLVRNLAGANGERDAANDPDNGAESMPTPKLLQVVFIHDRHLRVVSFKENQKIVRAGHIAKKLANNSVTISLQK